MNKSFDNLPIFKFDEEYQKLSPSVKIICLLLESIISLTSIATNLIIVISFIKEPNLRRQTNYYIISLACADFIMDLIGVPFAVFKVCFKLIKC